MTTLADMVFKAQNEQNAQKNGAVSVSDTPWDMVAPTPIVNSSNLTDRAFYNKMWTIDPEGAKVFMESRLSILREKLVYLRNEMKQLEEFINYNKDVSVTAYYKRSAVASEKVTGLKSHILAYMRENIGKDIRPSHVWNYFQEKGLKDWTVASVNQTLNTLARKKLMKVTSPYRGYYRMDA